MEERIRDAAAARDEGIAQVENGSDPRVILAIDAAIQAAIESGRRFSANDIRDQFPVSDEHLVGARFRAHAQKRVDSQPLMVCVGRTTSTLKSTRHHEIKVWLGWDAHRAVNRVASATS
ncbi:hypothetical protein [Nocardioides sp.]|uniref:hypothetical protein n=1 Tax=Nocardioides sp. TaxID=35761 RepID=UPI002D7FA826|nr:hypothetical protein [Nocardioides sp.]